MKTTIEGVETIIKFAYGPYEEIQTKPGEKKIGHHPFPRRLTTCYAKRRNEKGEQIILAEVNVKNDSRNRFNTVFARRKSMAKLLSTLNVSREERRHIWEDFFNQHPTSNPFKK